MGKISFVIEKLARLNEKNMVDYSIVLVCKIMKIRDIKVKI